MKNIKCIAIDLDRTTLDSRGRLPARNREALLKAMEQGLAVVLASGRPYTALPAEVLELPGLSYAITGNGCAVYDLRDGSRLTGFCIDSAAVAAILDLCRSLPVKLECFINGHGYIDAEFHADPVRFGTPAQGVPYIQSTRTPVSDIRSFILENSGRIDALDVIALDSVGRDHARQLIEANVAGLYLTTSAGQLLEISSHQCGKWSGLRYVLDRLGLSPAQAAAFGDNDNDADMLANVPFSFAMANSTGLCRSSAAYMTGSNDECGVAVGIEMILHSITGE